MKKIGLLLSVIIVSASLSCFAMGGGAPQEENANNTPASNRVNELDKARSELKMERAELAKVEKYIWVLDGNIIEARKRSDTKRLLDLKEKEQDTLERAKLIQASISKKMEKYPELKVSEDIEKGNGKPTASEMEVVGLPVPAQKPAVRSSVKPESGIVYHTVIAGDTLFGISRKYYGTPGFYKDIAKLNNIDPKTGLNKGMKLKIDLDLKSFVIPKAEEPLKL